MNEMEKLEKIATGLESKIQLEKVKNQKLQDDLNHINMTKAEKLKEIARLKQVGIDLENNITQRKEIIANENSKQEMENLLSDLGGMFKWRK